MTDITLQDVKDAILSLTPEEKEALGFWKALELLFGYSADDSGRHAENLAQMREVYTFKSDEFFGVKLPQLSPKVKMIVEFMANERREITKNGGEYTDAFMQGDQGICVFCKEQIFQATPTIMLQADSRFILESMFALLMHVREQEQALKREFAMMQLLNNLENLDITILKF